MRLQIKDEEGKLICVYPNINLEAEVEFEADNLNKKELIKFDKECMGEFTCTATVTDIVEVCTEKAIQGSKIEAGNPKELPISKDVILYPFKHPIPRSGMGYDYYDFFCPRCEGFLEPEPKGMEMIKEGYLTRCPYCGQLLEW